MFRCDSSPYFTSEPTLAEPVTVVNSRARSISPPPHGPPSTCDSLADLANFPRRGASVLPYRCLYRHTSSRPNFCSDATSPSLHPRCHYVAYHDARLTGCYHGKHSSQTALYVTNSTRTMIHTVPHGNHYQGRTKSGGREGGRLGGDRRGETGWTDKMHEKSGS